jgi:dTDP-4-amino-4,6-dideoxygalactose transaminase
MLDQLPVMRPWIDQREFDAVARVLRSGWLAQGPEVEAFEEEFARAVGARHGVAVSSATAALELALTLLGIGPGDEVIVPSLSFIATANSVHRTGARVVFADVDPEFGNLTADSIAARFTDRTAAVIVVHQGGVPAPLHDIEPLCAVRGVPVIEDAACAAGARFHDRPVGASSTLAAWSFHPRKILTTGEGGMLTTESDDFARRARRLREHGASLSAAQRHNSSTAAFEQYVEPGFNMRMTDVQAAIGRVQLARLDEVVDERRMIAAWYADALKRVAGVTPVGDPPWGRSNVQSLWVALAPARAHRRDAVIESMFEHGVFVRRGIMAAHLQPAYAGHATNPLPVTERLTASTLILPVFHGLAEADVERVCEVLASSV